MLKAIFQTLLLTLFVFVFSTNQVYAQDSSKTLYIQPEDKIVIVTSEEELTIDENILHIKSRRVYSNSANNDVVVNFVNQNYCYGNLNIQNLDFKHSADIPKNFKYYSTKVEGKNCVKIDDYIIVIKGGESYWFEFNFESVGTPDFLQKQNNIWIFRNNLQLPEEVYDYKLKVKIPIKSFIDDLNVIDSIPKESLNYKDSNYWNFIWDIPNFDNKRVIKFIELKFEHVTNLNTILGYFLSGLIGIFLTLIILPIYRKLKGKTQKSPAK